MTKGRILVVEDDIDISNMLRIYFSGQGYEVQVAPRGGDALTMTRKQLPNLIVLDIMLPDMNGYDVCRELRTTTRTSHIPIIFLTQKDERSDKIQGLELGADDYITKPFDIEELKLRVQNAIAAANRQTQIDSKSNLPTGRLIGAANNVYGAPTSLTSLTPQTVTNVGGSQAHLNMQPFLTLNFSIALQGIFPSPN